VFTDEHLSWNGLRFPVWIVVYTKDSTSKDVETVIINLWKKGDWIACTVNSKDGS
jgi:hypothetical protein